MKHFTNKLLAAALMVASFLTFSCSEDSAEPVLQEGFAKSSLIFTEMTGGQSPYPHGDHFHGLGGAVEGESFQVDFDASGNAIENGHIHLEVDGIYKLELQAWDQEGNRVEGDFIKDKATADQYKAFVIGNTLVLNTETKDGTGAIFQPREQAFGDETAVSGQYETTGIISFFTLGESNQGNFNLSYVLRQLNNPKTKMNIHRSDWNASDYATRFAGTDVLKLNFEIHAEHDHDHYIKSNN